MYKAIIINKDGRIISKEFKTDMEAQDFILDLAEKGEVKRADMLNKETGERTRDITKGL